MLQVTPQMRIFVAIEPIDFRCGIDGLAALCRLGLKKDPFSGAVFVFRNRQRTALKLLVYDSQGFWMCHKRFSSERMNWWPSSNDAPVQTLEAFELHALLYGGDPRTLRPVHTWRRVSP